jgi:hypothetical protein
MIICRAKSNYPELNMSQCVILSTTNFIWLSCLWGENPATYAWCVYTIPTSHTHTKHRCPELDSNPRSRRVSERRQFKPYRPRSYCDRCHKHMLLYKLSEVSERSRPIHWQLQNLVYTTKPKFSECFRVQEDRELDMTSYCDVPVFRNSVYIFDHLKERSVNTYLRRMWKKAMVF